MAKYGTASEEFEKLFNEVRDNTTINNFVEFEVLTNSKQKEAYKIIKLNDLVGAIVDRPLDFAVVINEEIFEQLPIDLQIIAINECLSGVYVSDTDAVSLEKPDFSTYTGVLQKFGHENVIKLKESIKSLYDAQKEEQEKAKAQKKQKKGKTKDVI
jgi:hypothetical protein